MKTLLAPEVPRFRNREDAGRKLAKRLAGFAGMSDTLVLAIPKRSVPVATAAAACLGLPFDVFLTGKITLSGHSLPIGAVTDDGVRMLNYERIDQLRLTEEEVRDAVLKASLDLARRQRFYRGHHLALSVADQTVILIDDGATPRNTLRDAIRLLRRKHAERIVLAMPVIGHHAAADLRLETEDVICLAEPERSQAHWLHHFTRIHSADR